MSRGLAFEICVDSPEGALAAEQGGADRVELCDNLFEGGTTPSHGAITLARELLSIKLHVIIRPRGGDFLYTDSEFEIMKRDIAAAKDLGVDGVVIGMLRADGTIDRGRTAELVSLARPMSVTFHRAFDVCRDPLEALDTLAELGVDRILTSGQRPNATEGTPAIAKLVTAASGRIIVLACGGLKPSNIVAVAAKTAAREFHFTVFREIKSEMAYWNESVSMGDAEAPSEYMRRITCPDLVRETIKSARSASPH